MPFFRAALGRDHERTIRVLDLGGGAGFVAAGLSDIAEVTAIDTDDIVREAPGAGASSAVQGDGLKLPFRNEVFDAVVCSEVLEHTTDVERLLDEAARVTKSSGLFLFSTPTRTRLSRLLMINVAQRWRATKVLPEDLHTWEAFLTPTELEALLAARGFVLRRRGGLGIEARPWPATLTALVLLRLGRISYAEAGRRIKLTVTNHTRVAMIGFAEKVAS